MGNTLQTMLRDVIEVFRDGEKSKISEIARMDDTVDDLHMAIKLYLTDVSREPLDEKESGRCAEIMSFNTNLEHIGDIIDKNLLELASKKVKYDLQFSEDGLQDIVTLHGRVEENLQLAMNVFVSGDRDLARRFFRKKSISAMLNGRKPKAITSGCVTDSARASNLRRCIWICCATSSGSTAT